MFILRGIEWDKSFYGDSIVKTSTSNFVSRGKEYICGIMYTKSQVSEPECCWWCKKDLEKDKIFALPIKEVFPKKDVLPLAQEEGYFCGRSCAKAYALENISRNKEKYSKALSLLEAQHRKNGGKKDIVKSPHWKFLNIFSGPLTREQYEDEMGCVDYDENPSYKSKERNPTSCYFKEVVN